MNYENANNLLGKVHNNIVCAQSSSNNHQRCNFVLYISQESLIRHEASGLWLSGDDHHK